MKDYNEYKPSEIEWIGDIPAEWNTIKLKWLTPIKRGASPRPIDDLKYFDENGEFAWVRIADVTASERYLEQTTERLSELGASLSVKRYPGDFFVSIAGSVGKPIITKIKCCIHDGFVWFPELTINPEYLFYIFQTGLPFIGLGKLGTQLNLNTETIGNISIPNLTKENIECIVKYLNHQTAIIDQLILQKERLIELLKEKRQAVINEAVTKGLNPNAKMKDSGIEWLGEVPEDWKVIKLKHVVGYIKGFAFKTEVFREEGVPIVKASDIKNLTIKSGKDYISKQDSQNYEKVRLFEGDIVISTVGSTPDVINSAVGQIAKVPIEFQGSCLNQNTVKFYPSTVLLLNDFLFYLLNTNRYRKYLDLYAHGTANQASLKIEDMLDFTAVLPSIGEQEQIIVYLEKKIHQVQNLLEINLNCIEKLKEFRQSIISEAVTGKIDVRDWQPNNPHNN